MVPTRYSYFLFNVIFFFVGDTIEKLIARGYIDVENRWFSKSWQKMQRDDSVPIERILLYENGHVQGHVNVLLQLDKIDKFHLLKTINLNVTQTSTVEIRYTLLYLFSTN